MCICIERMQLPHAFYSNRKRGRNKNKSACRDLSEIEILREEKGKKKKNNKLRICKCMHTFINASACVYACDILGALTLQ